MRIADAEYSEYAEEPAVHNTPACWAHRRGKTIKNFSTEMISAAPHGEVWRQGGISPERSRTPSAIVSNESIAAESGESDWRQKGR
jgi:hypothetical protein